MIKVIYDPFYGNTYPDSQIEQVVRHHIKSKNDKIVAAGNSVLFNRFRLAVCEKEIDTDNIEFWFQNNKLEHNEYGNFKDYPKGLADYDVDICERLIMSAIKIRKEKRNKK